MKQEDLERTYDANFASESLMFYVVSVARTNSS
jgi:hypothetical protein